MKHLEVWKWDFWNLEMAYLDHNTTGIIVIIVIIIVIVIVIIIIIIIFIFIFTQPYDKFFRWVSRKTFTNESDESFLNNFFFIFTVLGAIAYWLFGYAFAFGADGNGFIGHEYFALSYLPSGTFSHWFFHFVFAATAATIVSGAMAERTEFKAYLVYSVFLTGQL